MRQGCIQLRALFALLLLARLISPSSLDPVSDSQGSQESDRSEQLGVDKGTKPFLAPEAPKAAPSPHPTPQQASQQSDLPKQTEQPQTVAVGEDGTGVGGGSEAVKAAENLTGIPPNQPDTDLQPPEAQVVGGEPSAAAVSEEGDDIEEDRHNFALAKDGAKVISANKEAKKTGAVLDSDGDTFLKNECKADKWFIVELSQVTKMDTLVIAQNELYSSRMKEFEVRGRQSHPRTEGNDYSKTLNSSHWQLLGRFEASNVKGTQAFKLENPSWLKFLQIRQLSHHGTEAVCALNDVCVYGKSAAEDLEDRLSQESPEQGAEIPAVPIPESLEGVVPILQQEGSPVVLEPPAIVSGENGSVGLERQVAGAAVDAEVAAVGLGQTSDPEVQVNTIKVMPVERGPLPPPVPIPAPEAKKEAAPKPAHTLPLPAEETADKGKPEVGGDEKREPEKGKMGQGEAAKEAAHPTEGSNGGGGSSNGGGGGGKAEDPLTANSASSAASRHGGSVYDVIVQELKAIKVAQKDGSRELSQLRANTSAVLGRLALEVDMLTHRLNRLDPPVQALLPPQGAGAPVLAGGRGCAAREGESLDFREATGQCRNPEPRPSVRAPTELEVLQQEVARLHAMALRSKRQGDALLLVLAVAFLGGLGVSAAFIAAAGRNLVRVAVLLTGCVPVALIVGLWLTEPPGLQQRGCH